MAWWVKALAAKPDNLRSVPRIHMEQRELTLIIVFWPLTCIIVMYKHACAHVQINVIF